MQTCLGAIQPTMDFTLDKETVTTNKRVFYQISEDGQSKNTWINKTPYKKKHVEDLRTPISNT